MLYPSLTCSAACVQIVRVQYLHAWLVSTSDLQGASATGHKLLPAAGMRAFPAPTIAATYPNSRFTTGICIQFAQSVSSHSTEPTRALLANKVFFSMPFQLAMRIVGALPVYLAAFATAAFASFRKHWFFCIHLDAFRYVH